MDIVLLKLTLQIEQENLIQQKAGKSANFTSLIKLMKKHICLSADLGVKSTFSQNLYKLEKLQSKLENYQLTGEFIRD
ncbi:hypothetical protein [Aliiglaciecola sp. NS0011-25]|uniref:hypothetical protein n=1 Tax=Aliiglaciecola sp. NS0011-25 TaxID=3127654 RepID=UPI0031046C75